jgi:hypothetical protein
MVKALSVAMILLTSLFVASAFAASGSVHRRSAGLTSTKVAPTLGRPWAPYQIGYGHPHPRTVYNGGDPTGWVRKIRWTGWGRARAVGVGVSTYVWPGTSVVQGTSRGARIVAFHLGTCRGRPSYNAVTWFFPQYDENFEPHQYINACTGKYVGSSAPTIHCADAPTSDDRYRATEVVAIWMSCQSAHRLIAVAPVARYFSSAGRFMQSGFRCGSWGALGGSAWFDCGLGRREFFYVVKR